MLEFRCSRVLIGGLGLGFTLRAALDELSLAARVQVVELNPQVVEWCRTVAAGASGNAALDRRVRITTGDVAEEIRLHAEAGAEPPYDAILWDLYVGPPRRYAPRTVDAAARGIDVTGNRAGQPTRRRSVSLPPSGAAKRRGLASIEPAPSNVWAKQQAATLRVCARLGDGAQELRAGAPSAQPLRGRRHLRAFSGLTSGRTKR